MTLSSPEREAWVARARAASLVDVASRWVKLAKHGHEMIGPCPCCGGTDRFSINTRKRIYHCRQCSVAKEPCDVIALVMKKEGLDFDGACEWLTDEPAPGKKKSEEIAEKRGAKVRQLSPQDDAKRQAEDNAYRNKEIGKARGIWDAGAPIAGTPAEAYLAGRGITLPHALLASGMLERAGPQDARTEGETA